MHEMRGRIVEVAERRFRRHGYRVTTVAEIAGELRVSTPYVYKFFPGKLAICEAVCGVVLDRMDAELWRIARSDAPASRRIERLFQTLLAESLALCFNERKLHDMVAEAMDHRWDSVERHRACLREASAHVILEGRASGDFETTTPIGELAGAVFSAMLAFTHPKALEHALQTDIDLAAHARWTARLVLAGLRAGPDNLYGDNLTET